MTMTMFVEDCEAKGFGAENIKQFIRRAWNNNGTHWFTTFNDDNPDEIINKIKNSEYNNKHYFSDEDIQLVTSECEELLNFIDDENRTEDSVWKNKYTCRPDLFGGRYAEFEIIIRNDNVMCMQIKETHSLFPSQPDISTLYIHADDFRAVYAANKEWLKNNGPIFQTPMGVVATEDFNVTN